MSDHTIHEGLKRLKATLKKNCGNGYWNYSPYMHGLTNGMIYAVACIENAEPVFLLQPDVWLNHDYSMRTFNDNGIEEYWNNEMPDRRNSGIFDRRKASAGDRRSDNGNIISSETKPQD